MIVYFGGFLAVIACFVGAVIFGLTTMDTYSDLTNLNCANDPACWPTDWRELAVDVGGTLGCFVGMVVIVTRSFPSGKLT